MSAPGKTNPILGLVAGGIAIGGIYFAVNTQMSPQQSALIAGATGGVSAPTTQSSSGGGFSLPFTQNNIQKSVNVTSSIEGIDTSLFKWQAQDACAKISASQSRVNQLLGEGVKVISSSQWTGIAPAPYATNVTCIGTTYILEGPASLLDTLPN